MDKKEAIKIINNMPNCFPWEVEALYMGIKALEQQPCEDCISRDDAIELIAGTDETNGNEPIFSGKQVIKMLKGLPSVIPQPKMGKWIIIDDYEHFIAKCSECGQIEDSRMINKYPYCHCGAKMEVEE